MLTDSIPVQPPNQPPLSEAHQSEVLLVVSRSAPDSNGIGKISLNSPLPPLAILSLISTLIEMLVKDITFKSQKRIDIAKPGGLTPGGLMNFLRHKK